MTIDDADFSFSYWRGDPEAQPMSRRYQQAVEGSKAGRLTDLAILESDMVYRAGGERKDTPLDLGVSHGHWEAQLEARRARLQHERPATELESIPSEDSVAEEGDASVARELFRVDAALWRLREGSFGRCIDCGQSLEAARLHAEPTTARCPNCQGDHDARSARQNHTRA